MLILLARTIKVQTQPNLNTMPYHTITISFKTITCGVVLQLKNCDSNTKVICLLQYCSKEIEDVFGEATCDMLKQLACKQALTGQIQALILKSVTSFILEFVSLHFFFPTYHVTTHLSEHGGRVVRTRDTPLENSPRSVVCVFPRAGFSGNRETARSIKKC